MNPGRDKVVRVNMGRFCSTKVEQVAKWKSHWGQVGHLKSHKKPWEPGQGFGNPQSQKWFLAKGPWSQKACKGSLGPWGGFFPG